MAWFVLTAGIPPEPSYEELLSGQDQPQPHSFLKRLFQELAGVALKAGTELVREKQSYVEDARGYCGDPTVGYVWDSSIPVHDTSLPVDETYVTYGLPDVTLIWSVAYRKRGQLGYATWTGQGLSVRMAGHTADVIDRIWTEVFGTRPVFVQVPPQDEQRYESVARQREKRLRADLKARPAAP